MAGHCSVPARRARTAAGLPGTDKSCVVSTAVSTAPSLFSNLRKLGCGSVATSTQLQSWAGFQIKGNLVSFPRHRDKNRVDRNLRGSAGVPGLHLEKPTGPLVSVPSNTLFKREVSASTTTPNLCPQVLQGPWLFSEGEVSHAGFVPSSVDSPGGFWVFSEPLWGL